MASFPGWTLEAWVGDLYMFETPEEYALQVAKLEPAREYVEEVVLPGFDEETMSWRDYRNNYGELVEKVAQQESTS